MFKRVGGYPIGLIIDILLDRWVTEGKTKDD
jgi:hypothetical protein